jgi:hypothetical protein
MNGKTRNIGWLIAAGLLGAALIVPSAAAAMVPIDWATVTGYAEGSSDNNKPETWGDDCTKLENPGGSTYLLTESYALVIVKAGSDQSADAPNTLFANASAGETVWADSNESGAYDEGDKGISHIIFCGPVEEESDEPSYEAESDEPSDEVKSESPSDVVESDEPSDEVKSDEPSDVVESDEPSDVVESDEPSGSVDSETGEPSGSVDSETGEPSGSVEEVTGTPEEENTPPQTDALGSSSNTASGSGLQMVLLGLAALVATALIVTPSRKRL